MPFECLPGNYDGENESNTKLLRGAKAFEEPEYSSGVLVLPPESRKELECSQQHEMFSIVKCESHSIHVTINDKTFKVSKDGHFQVPAGNMYSIYNSSKTKECKMNFVLIRPANEWKQQFEQEQGEQKLQSKSSKKKISK